LHQKPSHRFFDILFTAEAARFVTVVEVDGTISWTVLQTTITITLAPVV
jgi:hypothetical protein